MKQENQIVVIIPCSSKKRKDKGNMPAYERYDGPLWRTFRKWRESGEKRRHPFRFFALSAEYGLIPIEQDIPDYDTKLSLKDSIGLLDFYIVLRKQLSEFNLEGNKVYAFTSRDYSMALKRAGLSFDYVSGGIGQKRQRLGMLLRDDKLPKKMLERYQGVELSLTVKDSQNLIVFFWGKFGERTGTRKIKDALKSILSKNVYEKYCHRKNIFHCIRDIVDNVCGDVPLVEGIMKYMYPSKDFDVRVTFDRGYIDIDVLRK